MRIEDHSKEYLEKLNEHLGDCLEESADIVKDNAKIECPVKTGKLQNSIEQYTDRQNLQAIIGSDVFYAYFVEMGTRKMAPRAYLRRGLINSIPAIRAIFS
jgi:HK97 gp10 family phage protein